MDVDALIEGFEYDLWANLLWVEPARRSGQEDLFRHILAAQAVWLARCRDVPIGAATEGDLEEIARDQSGAWISYLRAADPGSPIRYRREEKDFVNPIHEIARHVVNHGTYHRGQMRGVCGERGIEFPETDFIRFCREREQG